MDSIASCRGEPMATLNKLVELLILTIEPYVDDGETSARVVLEA